MLKPPRDIANLDADLAKEPTHLVQHLAESASRDLYLFATGVLGYRDLTPSCHGPLCAWHDGNESRYKLTLMPRGHFKTTVVTIAKNLQRITRNPEARILLANETATNAERFLSAIKAHAESNKRFRTLYSHLIPPDIRKTTWSQQAVTFVRDGVYTVPSIDTIGMSGAMTSRHYTHLSFDDPISADAANSKLVMDGTIGRISNLISLMDDPSRDTIDLTGTRWAFWDVYKWFEQTFSPAMFIRSDVEDGDPIFPDRFDVDTLAQIRTSLGEYLYSCQYRNNPRNIEVQDFNVQDLKFWKWMPDEESLALYGRDSEVERIVRMDELDITVTIDPAYADGLNLERLDRNAAVTCGTTEDGDAIVLDAWGKRCTPRELVDRLLWSIRRFRPRAVGIQRAGYEVALKYFLQAEMQREDLYAHVIMLKPGGKGKPHIRGLQPVAATGHLYLSPTQHELRTELSEYPLGQHDDIADALGLQTQLWQGVSSEEAWQKYQEAEDKYLRRLVHHDASGRITREMAETMPLNILEDMGYDPEDGRYGRFSEVSFS